MTKKRRKRHTPEQIVKKLRDAEAMLNSGKELAAVLQSLEISEADVLPLAKPVRWDEGDRGQTIERA